MKACHSDLAVAGEESLDYRGAGRKNGDVWKPGLMLRISLQRFAQHDKFCL